MDFYDFLWANFSDHKTNVTVLGGIRRWSWILTLESLTFTWIHDPSLSYTDAYPSLVSDFFFFEDKFRWLVEVHTLLRFCIKGKGWALVFIAFILSELYLKYFKILSITNWVPPVFNAGTNYLICMLGIYRCESFKNIKNLCFKQ